MWKQCQKSGKRAVSKQNFPLTSQNNYANKIIIMDHRFYFDQVHTSNMQWKIETIIFMLKAIDYLYLYKTNYHDYQHSCCNYTDYPIDGDQVKRISFILIFPHSDKQRNDIFMIVIHHSTRSGHGGEGTIVSKMSNVNRELGQCIYKLNLFI